MQTFLPYRSFYKSAIVLDNKRLGKQRVEAMQILKALCQGPNCVYNTNEKAGKKYKYGKKTIQKDECWRKTPWYNHPATQMWLGYEASLAEYGIIICKQWIARGFNDNCLTFFTSFLKNCDFCIEPEWLGLIDFHMSHQSNLLRKNKEYYSTYFNIVNNLPYYWPIKHNIN